MSRVHAEFLRPLILRVAHHPWFRRLATGTRPGRAVAGRFVAGETLAEAMSVARELDRARTLSLLDHLGENVRSPAQALQAREAYLSALAAIRDAPTLDCAISIKLTQLGLDDGIASCLEHVERIVDAAAEDSALVMIDMEGHRYVDATLEIAAKAYARYPKVGVALQSYLRRTGRDVFDLPAGMRIRLTKGAYLEPSEIVYGDKQEVDASFAHLFVTLFARGHPIDVATHDPAMIDGVTERVAAVEGAWSRVEFQMLYGVRRDLQAQLAREGYPIRVYVPYGSEWYPYLTRRLAERPANLWFFASNLMRSGR